MLKLFKRLAGHKKNTQRTIIYVDYDDNNAIKEYTSDDIGINNFVVYSNITVLHDTKVDDQTKQTHTRRATARLTQKQEDIKQ